MHLAVLQRSDCRCSSAAGRGLTSRTHPAAAAGEGQVAGQGSAGPGQGVGRRAGRPQEVPGGPLRTRTARAKLGMGIALSASKRASRGTHPSRVSVCICVTFMCGRTRRRRRRTTGEDWVGGWWWWWWGGGVGPLATERFRASRCRCAGRPIRPSALHFCPSHEPRTRTPLALARALTRACAHALTRACARAGSSLCRCC